MHLSHYIPCSRPAVAPLQKKDAESSQFMYLTDADIYEEFLSCNIVMLNMHITTLYVR